MIFRIASWFLIIFACFYGIGSYALLDNNEGLYASIARDMLEHGRFIIPHLNGVPYLEKPPMLYWLMAASMAIFGENEFAVHLVPALAYFLTIVSVQRFTHRTTGNEATAFLVALMLATSLPLLIWGRVILCDMVMTCFFTGAMLEFYGWQSEQDHPSPNMWEGGRGALLKTSSKNAPTLTLPLLGRGLAHFYFFLALAVLTKGLIAVILAGGIIVMFMLWQRKPANLLSPLGIGIFLAVAAPWHILACIQQADFAWFYFVNEQFLRFINQRQPHDYHTGPWWYYLPRILVYLFPWTLFLLIFTRKPRPSASSEPALVRFLWSWFFVCLVFFSIAGSKANYYMIIGMPPLALLIALHLKPYMDSGKRIARSLASSGLVLLVVTLVCLQHFCTENSGELFAACQGVSWNILIGAGLYCAIATALCWRVPQCWLAPLLGSHILILLPLAIAGVNIASERISQKNAALYLQSTFGDDAAIFQEFENVSALAFYMKKPLLIVDNHSSDLQYGQHTSAGNALFLSLREWSERKPTIPMVVLTDHLYDAMNELHHLQVDLKEVCVVKRFERVVILNRCENEH